MKPIHLILICFFAAGSIYSQIGEQKFPIDYTETTGELTSKDIYKSDFGRYKGFEIELYEGETLNVVLYSTSFQPALALIDPKGNVYKQNTGDAKGYSSILTTIPTTGNWIVYIIGTKNAAGKYVLQTAIAEPSSLKLDLDADFCTTMDYLIAHSTAYFYLLENGQKNQKRAVKIPGSAESFYDAEDGSYNSLMYAGNDSASCEAAFRNIFSNIKECIDKKWSNVSSNWKKTNEILEKNTLWSEDTSQKPRFVKISIYDLQNFSRKPKNRFEIYIQINRKR